MKNKIVSTVKMMLVTILILSFCLTFVKAEDNIISNEIESNNEVNTLSLNEQKEQVEKELSKAQEQLEYVQEELGESVAQIQKMDDKINEYQMQLEKVTLEYQALQESVEKSEREFEVAKEEYDKKYSLLQKRLVAIYKNGETTYLDVLLNSKGIIEFVSSYFIIQRITKYDSESVKKLAEKKQDVEKINNKLQEEKANLKFAKMQAEKQNVVLTNTKTVYENFKNSLSESEKKINSEIESYKKQSQELENLIQYSIDSSTYELKYSGGVMIWPTLPTSYITSSYGTRVHPIQGIIKNHDGIDIGGAMGDPIFASADGIVIYSAFNNGGYGNMIMIDHGISSEGVKVVSLYGHGNKLLKEVGDVVKQGDIIMEMGSTGRSTGPHVHFEVRENGTHVDPKKYLSAN